MLMREMSLEYQRAQLAIQGRIAELRAEGKQQTDPEAAERLQVRIKDLTPLLREARELAELTTRYYERSYHKNEKYTL